MELTYELPLSEEEFDYLKSLDISRIDRIVTTSHADYEYIVDPVEKMDQEDNWICFVEDVDNARGHRFDVELNQPMGSYLDSNGLKTRQIVKFSIFLNSSQNRVVKAINYLSFD